MSERYDEAMEALSYDPEPLNLDKTQIMREAYEGLCDLVDHGEITPEEANAMYDQWREIWGLE